MRTRTLQLPQAVAGLQLAMEGTGAAMSVTPSEPSAPLPGQHAGAPLRIALLGPPVVAWAGAPIPLLRRQTRGLLYCLAAELRPVARTQLCFLFWPDVPDATARRNLTRLVVLLRQSLPHPSLLLAEDEHVRLDPRQTWCDTGAFGALTTLTGTTGAVDLPARREALAAAVNLWRGPFLDGFALPDCPEFEAWLERGRRSWERRLFDCLGALIETQTAAQDYPGAIAAAQRYLQIDPLAEDIHRRLITLYAATGDRTAALRQFEECAVVLERELGVSPLPETRAAYDAARLGTVAGTVSPTPPPAAETLAIPAAAPAARVQLPAPATPLVGRERELAEVTARLRHPDVRLLTLTGPGGAGKTRLAVAAAQSAGGDFADGAVFVPLAPLRDAAHVIPAIAAALGLPDQDARAPLRRLQDALGAREQLLVLDNCEHVAAAAPDLAALLTAAPRLKLLVTSRALLHITGEYSCAVPPLLLADLDHLPALDELAQTPAVALFLVRVRMHLPDFRLTPANAREVAAICARLDGLPLAIELAAARAALLSPRMLLARLSHSLAILTDGPGDLPERQRTLRATIEWSYRLLGLSEQLLFARLAVFAGGWDLGAAEALARAGVPLAGETLDGLQALLDKQLVGRSAGGDWRFAMLETIREYALERLEARGEAAAVRAAHARYYAALAQAAAPALHRPLQVQWLDALDAEHANLRVALAELRTEGSAGGMATMACALLWFWFARGYLGEGRRWLQEALALIEAADPLAEPVPPVTRAHVHYAIGQLAAFQGDLAMARLELDTAIAHCRTLVGRDAQRILHNALMFFVITAAWQGDFGAVGAAVGEYQAVVGALDEPWSNAMAALNGGRALLHHHNDLKGAWALLQEAQVLLRAVGDDGFLTQVLIDLGTLALAAGDVEAADAYFAEALATARAMKDRIAEAGLRNNLGEAARLNGDDEAAAQHYAVSLRLHRDLDAKNEIPRLLHNQAYLALHGGDTARARSLFAASLAGFRAIGQPRGVVEAVAGLACLYAAGGSPAGAERAARLWGAAAAAGPIMRGPVWPADRAEIARYGALARGVLGEAAFDAAYGAGAGLTLDEAAAEALRPVGTL
ncbi:MAG: BTAD domain-containing putative transcriptional regulator [Caldilineaceae bacterium]